MKINKKQIVNTWCRLDNRINYLGKLQANPNISDERFRALYLERVRLKNIADAIMKASGFMDRDHFFDYIVHNSFEVWDTDLDEWAV